MLQFCLYQLFHQAQDDSTLETLVKSMMDKINEQEERITVLETYLHVQQHPVTFSSFSISMTEKGILEIQFSG